MPDSQDRQFRLAEDGTVSFQADPTNPLPGEPVARLVKGTAILEPAVECLDNAVTQGQDRGALQENIRHWLKRHIDGVLESLAALRDDESMPGAAKGIAFQVYESLGTLPRENVEELIGTLEPEGRQALRAKKIRLGPVLVFQPALNKPAAVRLRALLWSLYHGNPLPAPVPKDGIVSVTVDPQSADRAFYRSIGYPVFGPRAIRIDMLDRVINAVYDGAAEGKFRAQHRMAEWLGCTIGDLYQVLEAMGHRKIFDPAEAEKEEAKEQEKQAGKPEEKTGEQKEPQEKPELATFRLKKGKAFEKARKGAGGKKAAGKKTPRKDSKKDFKKKREERESRPRIISAGPETRPEDSPFAILEQLRARSDGKK